MTDSTRGVGHDTRDARYEVEAKDMSHGVDTYLAISPICFGCRNRVPRPSILETLGAPQPHQLIRLTGITRPEPNESPSARLILSLTKRTHILPPITPANTSSDDGSVVPILISRPPPRFPRSRSLFDLVELANWAYCSSRCSWYWASCWKSRDEMERR